VELLAILTNSKLSTILKIWFVSGGSSAALFGSLDGNQIAISSATWRKAGRPMLDSELIIL
jgi:hypothetical protein